jgi:hypothetical protein
MRIFGGVCRGHSGQETGDSNVEARVAIRRTAIVTEIVSSDDETWDKIDFCHRLSVLARPGCSAHRHLLNRF